MSAALEIPALDPASIPPARNLLFCGRRNTGKSTLLRDICFYRRHIQLGMAMAGSMGAAEALKTYFPDSFTYDQFDTTALATFWRQVKSINGPRKRRGQPMFDTCLILDDTGHDKAMWRDKTLREIMQNGRHYNLTLFMCLQDAKAVQPNMRSQFDYVFLLRERSPETLDRIWTCFAGGLFSDKRQFRSVLAECTKDYRAMVIRNSDLPADCDGDPFGGALCYYRARESLPRFVLGDDSMWLQHVDTYNEHYESDEDDGTDAAGNPKKAGVICARPPQQLRYRPRAKAQPRAR